MVGRFAAALGDGVFPRGSMPHHAPAENTAATATRPMTTLNPGREWPAAEVRRKNDNPELDAIQLVSSAGF